MTDHACEPPGCFVVTRYWPGNILTVERADPRILVTAELLDDFRAGHEAPGITVVGDVLRIDASNRTVIYRIGDKTPDRLAYYAEWPD